MDDYQIPYWLWICQFFFFRGLGTLISVYETLHSHSWEGYVFAGWLFLLPDAIRGREGFVLKQLLGNNTNEKDNSNSS